MKGYLYIDGKWVDTKEHFDIINPYNYKVIGSYAYASLNETTLAIQAADKAGPIFAQTTAIERSLLLRRLHNLIDRDKEEIAKLITLEQGKAIHESRDEVQYGLSYVEWFAEEAKRIYGDVSPYIRHNQMQYSIFQPVGVVGILTPWNFPFAMLARKISPCIASGCTGVVKPSEETPFIAQKFIQLVEEAGLMAGAINMVVGDYKSIGRTMAESELIKMITFTGSPKVGKLISELAAKTVKKIALELGGNAPFIVFQDADIDMATTGLVASKIRNGGQSCVCANRIFVHRSILQQFKDLLIKKLAYVKIGNGLDESNHIGPVINKFAADRIRGLVKDAKDKGAISLYECRNIEKSPGDCLINIEVLEVNSRDTNIEAVEIFGPTIALYPFDDEDEVIKRSNDSHSGLAAFIFSKDYSKIIKTTQALEYGMVSVNNVAISSAQTSFGGIKESGLGREGGKRGIFEFLQEKFISVTY